MHKTKQFKYETREGKCQRGQEQVSPPVWHAVLQHFQAVYLRRTSTPNIISRLQFEMSEEQAFRLVAKSLAPCIRMSEFGCRLQPLTPAPSGCVSGRLQGWPLGHLEREPVDETHLSLFLFSLLQMRATSFWATLIYDFFSQSPSHDLYSMTIGYQQSQSYLLSGIRHLA